MKKIIKLIKEKGFTLVELLAVIVILSIVIVIAVTAVIPRMKMAKKDAFIDKVYQFLDAAKYEEINVEDGDSFEKTYIFPADKSLTLEKYPDAGFIIRSSDRKYRLQIWDDDLELCAVKNYDEKRITISTTITTKASCTSLSENYPGEGGNQEPDSYEIVFHSNYKDGPEDVVQTVDKAVNINITENLFTRDGYKFIAWTTGTDGSGDVYSNNGNINIELNTSKYHLYAMWGKINACSNHNDITLIGSSICSQNSNQNINQNTICKRALALHQEKCTYTDSSYCAKNGYTESGSKGTNIITYGSCGTSGTLENGDAFTCDINGDGIFDEINERFYYTGKYYNPTTKAFDNTIATLIYFSATSSGTICNYQYSRYGSSKTTPDNSRSNMPTTTQWPNVTLTNTSRVIIAQNGTVMNEAFSYEGYSARLLLMQELTSVCENLDITKCNYVVENTNYANSSVRAKGFHFENPHSSRSGQVYVVRTQDMAASTTSNGEGSTFATKPTIEVPLSQIAY